MGLEVWREITTEYNGRAIKGSFKFVDGRVDVRTLYGSKTAQSGGQVPERIAKDLLRELAREGKSLALDSLRVLSAFVAGHRGLDIAARITPEKWIWFHLGDVEN